MRPESSDSSLFRRRQERWLGGLRRALCFVMAGIMAGWLAACSPLEPIDEPEVSDLQLTVDTMKTSLRDAQRTITELRAEVDSRRQELAELQIARAQLEGRVREAERRLSEARHVIELQREELAGSRSERERTSRSGAMLQSQLKQLQKQMAALDNSSGAGMAGSSSKRQRGGVASARLNQSDWLLDSETSAAVPAIHRRKSMSLDEEPVSVNPVRIVVKPGATLWSIAQRYRVPLKRLMAINGLVDHQIQAGQTLWLAEPPALDSRPYEAVE